MVGNGDHGQPWLAMVTIDRPWLDMVTHKMDHGRQWTWLNMVIAVFTKEEYCVHRKLKWAS
ncbi:hypothetical protein DPMN_014545 [Dreissena polymorpha]|uniref:Uncharacterized protein n=1 Tax=Dreissena polymorpha TaxID=45954 RepID=A0A9D4NB55_DREPO|nr:hypothetical protein DPMN_014545 [Dreissena polymorpha]